MGLESELVLEKSFGVVIQFACQFTNLSFCHDPFPGRGVSISFWSEIKTKIRKYTWAQNGRKTMVKWAQIERWLVSKGSRINRNFAELWSGRWESNPTPIAWKLLNKLRFFSRLCNTLEHIRGYFLDCFAVSIPENVGIDPKSDAGICVP